MLYVNNKFVGGLDFMRATEKNGGFSQVIPSTEIQTSYSDKISELVNKGKFMVFLRGTPDRPACSASRSMVAIIRQLNLPSQL